MQDTVTLRDVTAVMQPAELAVRIADEIDSELVELGDDARLLRLQLEELLDGVVPVRRLVVRDYMRAGPSVGPSPGPGVATADPRTSARSGLEHALQALGRLTTDDLLDTRRVAAALGLGSGPPRPRHGARTPGLPAPPPSSPFPRSGHRRDRGTLRRSAEDHAGHRWAISRRSAVWGRPGPSSVKDGLARLAEATISTVTPERRLLSPALPTADNVATCDGTLVGWGRPSGRMEDCSAPY